LKVANQSKTKSLQAPPCGDLSAGLSNDLSDDLSDEASAKSEASAKLETLAKSERGTPNALS